jgi:hypothetical protein
MIIDASNNKKIISLKDANNSKIITKLSDDKGVIFSAKKQPLFVAVQYNTSNTSSIYTSPDGINWTVRSSNFANNMIKIVYGNGLFVVLLNRAGTQSIITSPDGINWTVRTTPNATTWKDIVYGNGIFIAIRDSTSTETLSIMISTDGINWHSSTNLPNRRWAKIVYSNGIFYIGYNVVSTTYLATSKNGVSWIQYETPLASGTGYFLKVVNDMVFTGGSNRAIASNNLIDWNSMNITGNMIDNIINVNGLYITASRSGSTSQNPVYTSTDGFNWGARSAPPGNYRGLMYEKEMFIATFFHDVAPNNTTLIVNSSNGINWNSAFTGRDLYLQTVSYYNDMFLVYGNFNANARLLTSLNGKNWTYRDIMVSSIAYGEV